MDTRLSFQADLILLLQSPQANDHQLKVVYLRILKARQKKRAVSGSWRMDETYIKIKGEWWYYYRAVDKSGDIVDFYLSKARDENAARAFLRKAIGSNGLPHKVVIDKSGANALALHHINTLL